MTGFTCTVIEVAAHESVVVPDLAASVPGCGVQDIIGYNGWWDWTPLRAVVVISTLVVTAAAPDVGGVKAGVQTLVVADGLDKTGGACTVFGVAVAILASTVGVAYGPVGCCVPTGAVVKVIAVCEHGAVVIRHIWSGEGEVGSECGVVVMAAYTIYGTGVTGTVGAAGFQVFDTVDVLLDVKVAFGTIHAAVMRFLGTGGDWVPDTVMAVGTKCGVLKIKHGFGKTIIVHPAAVVATGIGTLRSGTAKGCGVKAVF